MKKIKYILYSLLVATFLFAACDETEDFDYNLHETTVEDIDTLILKTNHLMLLLDGVSELDLDVSLIQYAEELNEDGTTNVVEYELSESRLPEGSVKYFYQYEGQDAVEVGSNAYVGDVNTEEEKVYVFADVLGVQSEKTEITFKKYEIDEELYTEKTIPVIFHIFESSESKETEFNITHEHILVKFEEINIAFRRLTNKNPNGFDTKVNFVPAEYAPDGSKLEYPGMNIVKMNNEFAEEEYEAMTGNKYITSENGFNEYIQLKNVTWDYTKYFNVWIVESKYGVSSSYAPKHVLTGFPLIGLNMAMVDEGTLVDYNPLDVGAAIRSSDFINTSFTTVAGKWLGLLETGSFPPPPYLPPHLQKITEDYCDDTFTYNKATQGGSKIKTDYFATGFEYRSTNIMDKTSMNTTVTYEQGKRILHVVNYCPTRMCWK